MNREKRYKAVLDYFKKKMPDVTTELHFDSNFQLLVAVVLSAQCTDKRVNQVTPALFAHFPDAKSMAAATTDQLLTYMGSVSYPNAKARHLTELSRMLIEQYDGDVPSDMDSLLRLPGVGRKTANVIQSIAFGKNAIAVDTHVYRVSRRLGLVSRNDNTPFKVEQRLTKNIPAELVSQAHHWLLLHGRYVCTSNKPKCDKCDLSDFCPKLLEDSKL